MSDIFFTSDQHFNHANIIKYCNRPYASTEEMNEALVENYNNIIGPTDTVYHLGDLTWGAFDLDRLNGNKTLIIGNHDKVSQVGQYFSECYHYLELNKVIPKGRALVLMHFPIESWNGKFHKSIHLHGHTHGTMDNTGLLRFDVGVDSWDMKPVSLTEILEKRNERIREAEEMLEKSSRDKGFEELNKVADKG